MKKPRRNNAARRSQKAVERATKSIDAAGWTIQVTLDVLTGGPGRYVAKKKRFEREDESVTTLFESDYTIEGLAANVARREREEAR